MSPLILETHTSFHVLHPHYIISNSFLVSLNEREESQGTATNGCCCYYTVHCTTAIGVISLTGVESRFPRTIPQPLYTGKLRYKNYSCVGMLPLKIPLFVNTKSATSNTYNATKLVLHVSSCFQYSLSHIAACKYNNVATIVAGPKLPATVVFVSQLHCHFQWHEGSHFETHNILVLQKETCRINQNLDCISSFNET